MAKKPVFTEEERKQRHNEASRKHYKNNQEKIKAKNRARIDEYREEYNRKERERRAKNPEKQRAIRKKWVDNNKEKDRESRARHVSEKIKKDPLFKFNRDIRHLIRASFNRNSRKITKRKKTEEILGCTIEFFTNYIMKQCGKDLEAKDFGRYKYHIDHIIPLGKAKTEEEIVKLCHYTNFQPLWCKENLKKSDKILK